MDKKTQRVMTHTLGAVFGDAQQGGRYYVQSNGRAIAMDAIFPGGAHENIDFLSFFVYYGNALGRVTMDSDIWPYQVIVTGDSDPDGNVCALLDTATPSVPDIAIWGIAIKQWQDVQNMYPGQLPDVTRVAEQWCDALRNTYEPGEELDPQMGAHLLVASEAARVLRCDPVIANQVFAHIDIPSVLDAHEPRPIHEVPENA